MGGHRIKSYAFSLGCLTSVAEACLHVGSLGAHLWPCVSEGPKRLNRFFQLLKTNFELFLINFSIFDSLAFT